MQSLPTLGFFTNPQREYAVEGMFAAMEQAKNLGYPCCASPELVSGGLALPSFDELRPDIIIAFGGDGTILRAATYASELHSPILGVNFGRIGFLSELNPDGFDAALSRLSAGDYTVDRRMMLECTVNDSPSRQLCLNDTLLYKRSFSGVVDISMEIDGISAGSVLCDGIIISTSTGATGYSISAGGPVIAPGLDAMIITPICPHTLSVRPIITSADARMRFAMNSEGYVSLDGIYTAEISRDDEIFIRRAEKTVEFLRLGELNVYSLIRKKLS